MYIPFLISGIYLMFSNHYLEKDHTLDVKYIGVVLRNLLITELIYASAWLFNVLDAGNNLTWTLNALNVFIIFISQDIWFYSTHKLAHFVPALYYYHKQHHSVYGPFYAWHASKTEHIIINVMSIAVPIYLFPVHTVLINIIIMLQTWSSVAGHKNDSVHKEHHNNTKKRLGSIYIIDRVLGSY